MERIERDNDGWYVCSIKIIQSTDRPMGRVERDNDDIYVFCINIIQSTDRAMGRIERDIDGRYVYGLRIQTITSHQVERESRLQKLKIEKIDSVTNQVDSFARAHYYLFMTLVHILVYINIYL